MRLTISYQEPFVFSVSVLCFLIHTVNSPQKMSLTYAVMVN